MRTFLILLLYLLVASPAVGQNVSLHGVSLGEPFPEAISTLKERGVDVRTESSSWSHLIKCRVDSRTVTVAAARKDFESLESARVQEISSSLSVVDVSSQELVEAYNKYKELWSEKLGRTSPTQRGSIYYWSWATNRVEAEISYVERDMEPRSMDLTLARP